MKKPTRTPVPRTIVLPLAAAALLAACGDRPSGNSRSTGSAPGATAVESPDKGRSSTRTTAPADDAMMTTRVKAALLARAGNGAVGIKVRTRQRAVTLSGRVESAAVRNKAKAIAASVAHVRSVDDQMTLGG